MTDREASAIDTAGARAVRVSEIVRDPKYQIRDRLSDATVERYAEAMKSGERFPPVTLAEIDGVLVLIDGGHRLAAHIAANQGDRIDASILAHVPAHELPWISARANLRHGLPLKGVDFRAVFRAYVTAGKHRRGRGYKPYREMAQELGGIRGYARLHQWLHADFPAIAAAKSAVFGR